MIKRIFTTGLAIALLFLFVDPVYAINNDIRDENLTEVYIDFSEHLADMGIVASVCLEDFVDGYTDSSNIEQYVDELIEYEIQVSAERELIVQENTLLGNKVSPRSAVTRWYDNIGTASPSLPKAASYTKYNIENVVQKGDIVYETDGVIAQYTGHIALVEGTFWDATYNQLYIRTIESGAAGVVYGVLDDTRYDERGARVYKVTNSSALQKADAIRFCIAQLGKDYGLSLSGKCSYSSGVTDWYCSELVWAAYYNQGINFNGTTIPDNIYMPAELASSSELTRRAISQD